MLIRLVLVGAILGSSACTDANGASTATLTYTEDARLAYAEAMKPFQERDWETAKALFEEIKKRFAYTKYAKLADLRLADIAFERQEFTEAVVGYRDFAQRKQTDADVEYAKFRICKALYLDIDDTIVLPPHEERDQATAREAYRELGSFQKQFPNSAYRAEIGYMLDVATGRLVRHELYVARYYLHRDRFDPALARTEYALATYPDSDLRAEAMVLKGEILLKMKKRTEARAVFEAVRREHGGPFAKVAADFLATISGS